MDIFRKSAIEHAYRAGIYSNLIIEAKRYLNDGNVPAAMLCLDKADEAPAAAEAYADKEEREEGEALKELRVKREETGVHPIFEPILKVISG